MHNSVATDGGDRPEKQSITQVEDNSNIVASPVARVVNEQSNCNTVPSKPNVNDLKSE